MSIDQRITDDLAIVARTSSARPTALEATLARVGATATPANPTGFAASYIYATRVARAAAGIAALAAVATLVLYVGLVHGNGSDGLVDQMAHTPTYLLALAVGGFAAIAHVAAERLAMSTEHRDPTRVEKLSIGVSIVGGVAFLQFFGMALVLGARDVIFLALVPGAIPSCMAVLGLGLVACAVLARTAIPRRRWMLPIGLVTLVGTIAAGIVTGPVMRSSFPVLEVRIALTVTGFVALALLVTSIVLAVHERDDQYTS